MSATLIIYIWGILDKVGQFFHFASVSAAVALLCCISAALAGGDRILMRDETQKAFIKMAKRLPLVAVPIWIITCLIPSSNTFAAMVIVPKIIESEVIQKDMPEVYEAAKKRLLESLAK